jgi:hypothetical protein
MNVYNSLSYSDLSYGLQYNTKTAENQQIITPRKHSSLLHCVEANDDWYTVKNFKYTIECSATDNIHIPSPDVMHSIVPFHAHLRSSQ